MVGALLAFSFIVIKQILSNPPEDIFKYNIALHTLVYQLIILISCLFVGIAVSYYWSQKLKSHKTLIESEQRFRSLFDEAPLAYQSLDIDGNFVVINDLWCKLFGYERDNVIGRNFKEFICIEDRDKFNSNFTEFKKTGYVIANKFKMIKQDGSQIIVEVDGKIARNEDGSFKHTHCVLRDVTEKHQIEEALENERKRLNSLLETIPAFVCLIAPNYEIKFANNSFCNVTGEINPNGKKCYEVIAGRHEPCKNCSMFDIFELGKPLKREWTAKNGKQYVIYDYPFIDSDGLPLILELGADITEQKNIENALIVSEKRYRRYIENAPYGILIFDCEGSYIEANRAAEIITGYSKNEILSMRVSDLTVEEDKKRIVRNFNEALKKQETINIELLIIAKNKTQKCITYTAAKLSENKYIAFCQDITQRKKAENALAESGERYRIIAHKTNSLIYDGYVKSGRIDWSGNIESVTGYKAEEFKNVDFRTLREMIHPDDRDEVISIIDKAIQTCSSNVETRFHLKQKDGTYHYVYQNATILADSKGKAERVLGIVRDIAYQKEAQDKLDEYQRQLKSLALKVSMAEEQQRRRVAIELHDTIGQTLVICGIKLQIMKKMLSSDESRVATEEIIQLMREVIEQTKSLTFDMSSPILYEIGFKEAVQEYLHSQIKKKHKIDYELINEDGDGILEKDIQILLFRDIKELLTNVVKHANASKVIVALKKENNMFEITVEDNGVGFDVSKAKFSATRSGGFGLFSTKERMECVEGVFDIESSPGKGTKVILTVPLKNETSSKEA